MKSKEPDNSLDDKTLAAAILAGWKPNDLEYYQRVIRGLKKDLERANRRLRDAWDLFGRDRVGFIAQPTKLGDDQYPGREITVKLRVADTTCGEGADERLLQDLLYEILPEVLVEAVRRDDQGRQAHLLSSRIYSNPHVLEAERKKHEGEAE